MDAPTNRAQVSRRIDLHHHFFPSALDKLKTNAEMGWRTPAENLPWSPEISLKSMDVLRVDMAILSLPPSSSGSIGPENRRSARSHNDFVSSICKKYPDRFGFFATLPFLDDTEGQYFKSELPDRPITYLYGWRYENLQGLWPKLLMCLMSSRLTGLL